MPPVTAVEWIIALPILAVGGLCVLCLVGALARDLASPVRWQRLGRPVVTLPPEGARVGETLTCTVIWRPQRTVAVDWFRVVLHHRDWVQDGRDPEIGTTVRAEQWLGLDLRDWEAEAQEELRWDVRFPLPADYAPGHPREDGRPHEVHWTVQVDLQTQDGLSFQRGYSVGVQAAADASLPI